MEDCYIYNWCIAVNKHGTYLNVNQSLQFRVLLTFREAIGHPTPDLNGNRRGGIPHPKNNLLAYSMLLKHESDRLHKYYHFLVRRRLPPLLPRLLDRVVRLAVSSVILQEYAIKHHKSLVVSMNNAICIEHGAPRTYKLYGAPRAIRRYATQPILAK